MNEDDPGFEGPDAYNDPEQRPLGERCLIGFSSTSGPPILPTYFYNNLHQIVQTPTEIMILTEMVHDARIIRMNDDAPAVDHPQVAGRLDRTLGRRHARRRHDELHRQDALPRIVSENLHVVERFTRVDAKTLRYQFTIDDPTTWDRAVDRRIHLAGDRPSGSTNTPATKATTPWATSCAARG